RAGFGGDGFLSCRDGGGGIELKGHGLACCTDLKAYGTKKCGAACQGWRRPRERRARNREVRSPDRADRDSGKWDGEEEGQSGRHQDMGDGAGQRRAVIEDFEVHNEPPFRQDTMWAPIVRTGRKKAATRKAATLTAERRKANRAALGLILGVIFLLLVKF